MEGNVKHKSQYTPQTAREIMDYIWENHFKTGAFISKQSDEERDRKHQAWIKRKIELEEKGDNNGT